MKTEEKICNACGDSFTHNIDYEGYCSLSCMDGEYGSNAPKLQVIGKCFLCKSIEQNHDELGNAEYSCQKGKYVNNRNVNHNNNCEEYKNFESNKE